MTIEDGRVGSVEQRALDLVRWEVCTVNLEAAASVDEVYERVAKTLSEAVGAAD